MPFAPARPCAAPGCPALVRGERRCPRHRAELERARGTATQRGYDARWRRLVRVAIAAEPWCHCTRPACHPRGCYATVDLTGDHRVPLSRGGLSVAGNVLVLCRACNSGKRDR